MRLLLFRKWSSGWLNVFVLNLASEPRYVSVMYLAKVEMTGDHLANTWSLPMAFIPLVNSLAPHLSVPLISE